MHTHTHTHTHTQVAADMLQVCKFTHLELGEPVPCHELDQDRDDPGNMFIDNCVATVLKVRERCGQWECEGCVCG